MQTSQEPPSAARSPFIRFKTDFASDVPEPSTSRDAARRPFGAGKLPDDGYFLTLKRSSKSVYSAGRNYIYVGGLLRLATADDIGNNRPGARSLHDRCGDHVSLVRLL